MKTALVLRRRKVNIFSSALLLLGLFALGLWLGACVLPASSLAALYSGGNTALAAALPAASPSAPEENYPPTILLQTAGLPLLPEVSAVQAEQAAEAAARAAAARDQDEILVVQAREQEEEEAITVVATASSQVVIYCTHSSEEYSGQKRVAGKPGGVMTVASTLAEAFEARGIGVILDETLHDTDYNESYASSLATITSIAGEYPDIEIYIDVHRDSSIPGVNTTLSANGTTYAKMLLVVGSNQKLEHPDWQKNYAFAQQAADAANALLDGVMREPRVYSGRYNQHIADKAILVEIGSTDNTLEEAKRSAEILAKAIIECM